MILLNFRIHSIHTCFYYWQRSDLFHDLDFFVVLQKAFDSFAQGKGYITPEMVGTILRVMGQAFNEQTLRELIAEVDTDGQLFNLFTVQNETNETYFYEIRVSRSYDNLVCFVFVQIGRLWTD